MDSALPQQINNLLRDGVVTEVDHARHLCRVQTGEAHTDFLLAVIAEELGFFGVLAVIALFALVVQRSTEPPIQPREAAGDRSGSVIRLANVRLPLLSSPPAIQRMLGSRLSVRDLVELVEADLPLAVACTNSHHPSFHLQAVAGEPLEHTVHLRLRAVGGP